MARSDKPTVIDGLSSIRAVRHSGHSSGKARTRPPQTRLPGKKAAKKEDAVRTPAGARIGRTATPQKRDVLCYECGYRHTVRGQMHNTICPKCHETLDMSSHVIDGEWTGTIKTIGDVEVRSDAVLKDASLTARVITLEGNADNGRLRAYERLVLRTGASFNVGETLINELIVDAGSKLSISKKISCQHLNVQGDLKANVFTEGTVTVDAGGCLRGEVHSPHLVVREGGGLKARVFVRADAEEKKTRSKEEGH